MERIRSGGRGVVREEVSDGREAELVSLHFESATERRMKEKKLTSSHPFRPTRLTTTSMMLIARLKSGFSCTSEQRQCSAAGASGDSSEKANQRMTSTI